jgi:hypothetical protein
VSQCNSSHAVNVPRHIWAHAYYTHASNQCKYYVKRCADHSFLNCTTGSVYRNVEVTYIFNRGCSVQVIQNSYVNLLLIM